MSDLQNLLIFAAIQLPNQVLAYNLLMRFLGIIIRSSTDYKKVDKKVDREWVIIFLLFIYNNLN